MWYYKYVKRKVKKKKGETMLHYYNVHLEYYLDGKKLIRTFYRCLIDENKKEEIVSINWNNFKDFCVKYWGALPFHWETCRKGLRVKFINTTKVIKELSTMFHLWLLQLPLPFL